MSIADEGSRDAPAVLCVHGIPGSARDFRYLAPLLSARLRVIRVEMPGFGGSPCSGVNSISEWACVLLEVAQTLEVRRFGLLSHSFGGAAVVHAAARRPEGLAWVAMLAPPGPRMYRAYAVPPAVYRVAASLLSCPLTRPATAWAGRRRYLAIAVPPPRGWREISLHVRLLASLDFADLAAAASRVAVPALVLHAADDPMVEVDVARELSSLFPHGRFVEFASGGHHVQKTRAVEVSEAVFTLLDGVGRRSGSS